MENIKSKILNLMKTDLNKMINHQEKTPQKPNPIFNNFDKDFTEKLEDNRRYIQNINKSIHNTKK